ncbi:MAG: DEAD/DEAH box helicase [Bdellovibrionia bacterium]
MQYFNELKLPLALEKAIQAMRFEKPTPIQAQAIPVAMKGCDLIGCAQTGTGKTVAFSVPLLTRLLNAPQKTALILVPTRELAAQVAGVISKLTAFSPQLRSVLLIGGVAMQPQTRNLLRKPQIVIATPGRLIDHLNQKNLSLAATDVLVLDEADRMLDMGFAPQLSQILRHLPNARQTLCFSATFSAEMEKLAARFLKNPERVTVGAVSQPVQAIEQSIVQTTAAKKNDTLMDELNTRQGSVLVFARTQHRTDRVARYLESYGHTVTRLHGGRSQGQRTTAVSGFRDGRFRIMVATDIAARGIDISHIAHVINYDLPQVPEDYVHRIGRTGRAGAKGEAVSLITQEDQAQWREIVRMLRKSDKHPTNDAERGVRDLRDAHRPRPLQGTHKHQITARS